MYTAQKELKSTIAIRYPRGRVNSTHWETPFEEIAIGTAKQLKIGENIAVLSLGSIAKNIELAIKELPFSHYDMRFAKPIDEKLLIRIFEKYDKIVTVEDGTIIGGFGSAILEFAGRKGFNNKVYIKGIPDQFIEHGTIEELQKEVGLDPESLMKFISSLV
jgi:1-deoxy-D-xylulose-5-phosphate synthase